MGSTIPSYNLFDYFIMKEVEETQTKYAFIHIPKDFNIDEAAGEISMMLKSFSSSLATQ